MSELQVTIKPARKRGHFLKASRGNNHFFVHSRYEPIREAENWAGQISVEEDLKHLIFLGGGLGYFPRAMANKGHSFTILELLPEFQPPEDTPAYQQIEEGNFKFLRPDESPVKILKELSSEKLQSALPIIHPGYGELFGQRIKELEQDCLLVGRKLLRNRQTVRQFFWQWFDNFIANIDHLEETFSLAPLENSQAKVPGIIVGAGPSLHHSLDWLKKHQEKIFIIATDTALSTLQCASIKPDIALTIDPQENNANYLEGIDPVGCLVGGWESRPEFFEWANNMTRFSTYITLGLGKRQPVFPFSNWFEQFFPKIEPLQSGGSVTSTALDLAQYLNCGPIGLVGVDHGYTGLRGFPAGSTLEKKNLERLNRFQTLPQLHLDKIFSKENRESKRLQQVNGMRGKPMYTNDEYQNQNSWFEEAGGALPVDCYDFRADGLPMENWQKVDNPGRFFSQNHFSLPQKPDKKDFIPINIKRKKFRRATTELLDQLTNTVNIEKKLTDNSSSLAPILQESFAPLVHYAGMHGESTKELAVEFIDKLKIRLRKLNEKLA
ncbi:MAG: motility associated factor glycosyltransferase family protein [bacterium]